MNELEPPHIEKLQGPNDLAIYHRGPSLSSGPLPAFFYFALSGEDSLKLDPYNQPIAALASEPIHLFSFSLPFHGDSFSNTKAMSYWAQAFEQGDDFFQEFIEKSIENITFLIKSGFVDPQCLAAGGLSRGGFAAVHLAAQDDRIQTVLGYAPLTALEFLEEFKPLKNHPLIEKYQAKHIINNLASRQIHFFIGNRDVRVGTFLCVEFISHLTDKAYENGIRSPQVELSIRPSIGHKGHGTSPITFNEGVNWLKQKLLIVN